MLRLFRYPLAILPVSLLLGNFPSSTVDHHGINSQSIQNTVALLSPAKNSLSSASSEEIKNKYNQWNLAATGLAETTFEYAMNGYAYLDEKQLLHNKNVVTIVDLSKTSDQKRLYVLDVTEGKVLFNTLVAHGKNSGLEYATKFSNADKSHQTSLGFYITMDTYSGENGYSLRLQGCEKGFNDRAYSRAIVMHGSDYVSEQFIQNTGHLGRSYGCPSVPLKYHKAIIDLIKGGSCLFIYHPTSQYIKQSKLIKG